MEKEYFKEKYKKISELQNKVNDTLSYASESILEDIVLQVEKTIREEITEKVHLEERRKLENEYKDFLNGIRIDSYNKYLRGKDNIEVEEIKDNPTNILIQYIKYIQEFHKIQHKEWLDEQAKINKEKKKK